MKTILYPFMLLAACGLALSVTAHCMAIAGVAIPGGELVWGLHIGVFVVWLPAALISIQMTNYANRKDFWKIALLGCPVWMRRSLYVLFVYTFLNFIIFMATSTGQSKQETNGAPPAVTVRGFSGHWMIFYGAAFAILYSRIYAPQLYRKRKCPCGHVVSPAARFCSECGHEFSNKPENA